MGLYVISGCPRSGTSLMMDCHRTALGEDRLIGKQFFDKDMAKEEATEPTPIRTWVKYVHELEGHAPPDKDKDKHHDMNPGGFWEDGRFSVRGLHYKQNTKDILKRIQASETPFFAKIVSQGLRGTDPTYVDKVVFMLRHPRAVAKSQERLERGTYKMDDGENFVINSEVVHTPRMFINVTLTAARWFVDNPEVPYMIVNFDNLIESPATELQRVQDFLGEGNFTAAASRVNPKLRRSYPQEVDNSLWGEAETAYKLFEGHKFHLLLKFFDDPKRLIHRESRNWQCVRYGGGVVESHCKVCKASGEFRDSLVEFATENDIPWRDRPCAFEVAFDVDNELISIEESIEHNFWEEQHESVRHHQSPGRSVRPSGVQPYRSASAARTWRKHRGQRRAGSLSAVAG